MANDTITLDDARRVVAAAEKRAQEIGQPQNIAVVDSGGNLVTHARMDGAWIGSIDISINKAWTARAFDMETKELKADSQSGGPLFGIHASNGGRVMIFAGGVPLTRDGQIAGAIGVSGGDDEQDQTVAEEGAAALRAARRSRAARARGAANLASTTRKHNTLCSPRLSDARGSVQVRVSDG